MPRRPRLAGRRCLARGSSPCPPGRPGLSAGGTWESSHPPGGSFRVVWAEDKGAFLKVECENMQKASNSADFLFVCLFVFPEASGYSGRRSGSAYSDNRMFLSQNVWNPKVTACYAPMVILIAKCILKMNSHTVLWVPLCFSSYRLQFLEKEKFNKFCCGCWLDTDIMAVRGMSPGAASPLPEHILWTGANGAAGPLIHHPLIIPVVHFPQTTAKLLCLDDVTLIS